MDKPTIFFSHSSKDRDNLIILKDLLNDKTGGTLDIFLSSDGQTIRFGTNWVNRIEEGLQNARVMFVFVTPNSMTSNWIYFEAGYAYSKKIEVIPVGMGIDIGSIAPPLNLLQGFKITSADSLNNLIPIINKKFNCTFHNMFEQDEYQKVMKHSEWGINSSWCQLAESVETSLSSYIDSSGNKVEVGSNEFTDIKRYFITKKHDVSVDQENEVLLASGFKLYSAKEQDGTKYKISIAPNNFAKTFNILKDVLAKVYSDQEMHYLDIDLYSQYWLTHSDVKISSLIEAEPNIKIDYDAIGYFTYKDIKFSIVDKNEYYRKHLAKTIPDMDLVLQIVFNVKLTKAETIYELMKVLYDLGVIFIGK